MRVLGSGWLGEWERSCQRIDEMFPACLGVSSEYMRTILSCRCMGISQRVVWTANYMNDDRE